jgi:hypothetical protein
MPNVEAPRSLGEYRVAFKERFTSKNAQHQRCSIIRSAFEFSSILSKPVVH